VRLAEPNPYGASRPTELSLRFGADIPLVLVGNTVWRTSVGPSGTCRRQEAPPYLFCWRPSEKQVPGADRARL